MDGVGAGRHGWETNLLGGEAGGRCVLGGHLATVRAERQPNESGVPPSANRGNRRMTGVPCPPPPPGQHKHHCYHDAVSATGVVHDTLPIAGCLPVVLVAAQPAGATCWMGRAVMARAGKRVPCVPRCAGLTGAGRAPPTCLPACLHLACRPCVCASVLKQEVVRLSTTESESGLGSIAAVSFQGVDPRVCAKLLQLVSALFLAPLPSRRKGLHYAQSRPKDEMIVWAPAAVMHMRGPRWWMGLM